MSESTVIPVTQYLLPDGRVRHTGIVRPQEVYEKAQELIENGLRFEAELLTTGEVSLTLADPSESVDLEIEVVPNGPEVPLAFDRLVQRGWRALAPREGGGS